MTKPTQPPISGGRQSGAPEPKASDKPGAEHDVEDDAGRDRFLDTVSWSPVIAFARQAVMVFSRSMP
jgi:hypothetical protein